jgi:hypothetical protein
MKVIEYNEYLDGGTREVVTDEGAYSFDDRLNSTTKGKLYKGYPKDNNSNIVEGAEALVKEQELLKALGEYNTIDNFYYTTIIRFIDNRMALFTCYDCIDKDKCKYAFDLYNREGDCLAVK